MGSTSDRTAGVICGICSQTLRNDMDLYLHEWFDHDIAHSSSEDEEADGQGGIKAATSSSTGTHPSKDRQTNTDEGIHYF